MSLNVNHSINTILIYYSRLEYWQNEDSQQRSYPFVIIAKSLATGSDSFDALRECKFSIRQLVFFA